MIERFPERGYGWVADLRQSSKNARYHHGLGSDFCSCLLTDAKVPPEDVPVEDVEGEVSEAAWNLTVEVLPVERTAD